MQPEASILISSHNRLGLFRRTLWAIAARPPGIPFEVIVVDDGSTDDILKELHNYSARFPWKFVRFDAAAFEVATGLKKFLNNPCVTNNIAFKHSAGRYIFQQGNEVIAWGEAYNQMILDVPGDRPYWLIMSTTYDVPQKYLDQADKHGANITRSTVRQCYQWPLQSQHYQSDVTNYLSLCSRELFEKLKGYDERYFAGISADDSDFVRRARALPDFVRIISPGVSLHQYHQGKTTYYDPPVSLITPERWKEGAAINRRIYDAWDNTFENRQTWDWGTLGVSEVISNVSST